MATQYSVHVDSKGQVLIPAEVRRAMGLTPKSLLILKVEGGELRLSPGEIIPKRKVRMVSAEELAQGLSDSAITDQGKRIAREGILELGLNPDDYTAKF